MYGVNGLPTFWWTSHDGNFWLTDDQSIIERGRSYRRGKRYVHVFQGQNVNDLVTENPRYSNKLLDSIEWNSESIVLQFPETTAVPKLLSDF